MNVGVPFFLRRARRGTHSEIDDAYENPIRCSYLRATLARLGSLLSRHASSERATSICAGVGRTIKRRFAAVAFIDQSLLVFINPKQLETPMLAMLAIRAKSSETFYARGC